MPHVRNNTLKFAKKKKKLYNMVYKIFLTEKDDYGKM